jgi:hypothetical protein
LVRFIQDRQRETKQLDFKAEIGRNRAEEAKDIAALANQLGGDLIIGIREKDEQAEGWKLIVDSKLKQDLQQINQSLTAMIRPESFQLSVQISPIRIDDTGSVIAVSIPASSELIAVQTDNASSLSFPVRIETHTKYLSYEEVMKRSGNTTRKDYLRLKAILPQNSKRPIRFSNPVGQSLGNGVWEAGPLTDGAHGHVEELTEELLIVSVKAFSQFPERVTVPLELLGAIWLDRREESGNIPLLCVVLEGRLVWHGRYWIIQT